MLELQSSKSVLIGFLRDACMQILAEESLTRLCSNIESTMDAKDSSCLHAHNHIISNSVILNKNCFIAK